MSRTADRLPNSELAGAYIRLDHIGRLSAMKGRTLGHRDYRGAGFSSPRKQRNIVAFVGNGFDLQAVRDFDSPIDTRYESFYHFLKLRSFDDGNSIFKEMGFLQRAGRVDWSDVEAIVGELVGTDRYSASQLSQDLLHLQREFAEFLDLAVPSALLGRLGEESATRKLALASLEGFLGDLPPEDYRLLRFPQRTENFDIYNFVILNLNYTSILDNFIYLDQRQFDPMPFSTVDRNFQFEANPREVTDATIRPGDSFSSYVITEIIHPHGTQGVPRSLLFGIDMPSTTRGNQDPALRLAKPFWAQNEKKYAHLFNDTELFIIFGCSLGDSDHWWWRRVAESLSHERSYDERDEAFTAELIVYWYSADLTVTPDEIRDRFVESAKFSARRTDIENAIRVIIYNSETERTWLNTSRS